jgi:hypothetical protein
MMGAQRGRGGGGGGYGVVKERGLTSAAFVAEGSVGVGFLGGIGGEVVEVADGGDGAADDFGLVAGEAGLEGLGGEGEELGDLKSERGLGELDAGVEVVVDVAVVDQGGEVVGGDLELYADGFEVGDAVFEESEEVVEEVGVGTGGFGDGSNHGRFLSECGGCCADWGCAGRHTFWNPLPKARAVSIERGFPPLFCINFSLT